MPLRGRGEEKQVPRVDEVSAVCFVCSANRQVSCDAIACRRWNVAIRHGFERVAGGARAARCFGIQIFIKISIAGDGLVFEDIEACLSAPMKVSYPKKHTVFLTH